MTINPYTFSFLKSHNQVHDIGELWAMVLLEMYWNLVDKYGFSSDWYDSKQIKGNIMALQLVIGGLKYFIYL
jgi:extracellular elastinolytic metalloproteinase